MVDTLKAYNDLYAFARAADKGNAGLRGSDHRNFIAAAEAAGYERPVAELFEKFYDKGSQYGVGVITQNGQAAFSEAMNYMYVQSPNGSYEVEDPNTRDKHGRNLASSGASSGALANNQSNAGGTVNNGVPEEDSKIPINYDQTVDPATQTPQTQTVARTAPNVPQNVGMPQRADYGSATAAYAAEQAALKSNSGGNWFQRTGTKINEWVHNNPWGAVGIGAGIAGIASWFSGRRNGENRGYERGYNDAYASYDSYGGSYDWGNSSWGNWGGNSGWGNNCGWGGGYSGGYGSGYGGRGNSGWGNWGWG